MLNLARAAVYEMTRLAVPAAMALLILIPMFLALAFWWEGQNNAHRLDLIPKRLHVSRVIEYAYAGDQVPLPSANSNGLVIYELPASIAQRISIGGTAELQTLLNGQLDDQGRFRIWHETPFGNLRSTELSARGLGKGTLGDFMRHNWQPTESPQLEQDAVDLLQQSGNFYSFDQNRRLLIVAPSDFRVVFAFSE